MTTAQATAASTDIQASPRTVTVKAAYDLESGIECLAIQIVNAWYALDPLSQLAIQIVICETVSRAGFDFFGDDVGIECDSATGTDTYTLPDGSSISGPRMFGGWRKSDGITTDPITAE